ncbi:hypothetical protein Ancab_014452 [Ancistrocladus abbreviatus]
MAEELVASDYRRQHQWPRWGMTKNETPITLSLLNLLHHHLAHPYKWLLHQPAVASMAEEPSGTLKAGGPGESVAWILTTWTDDEVNLIMKNCHKALPVGGKLIACEPALPEHSDDSHRTRALLAGDIFVMTIYGAKGKHRTEEEYKQLGFAAGFRHFRAVQIDYFSNFLEFRK